MTNFEVINSNPAPGKHLARTMHLLASSTPAHPNEVRILVYGQSISKQAWWLFVKHDLEARFPHARLRMENRAIGGFHSTRLLRCVESDVTLFYPDLVIFHDYGPEEDYEAIIQVMRRRTATEVAVQNDHYTSHQQNEWHDTHSYEWLPELCERYQMELIDVRRNWLRYLEAAALEPAALLRDNVHLNEQGNRLMAEIVNAHLLDDPRYGPDPQQLVATLHAGENFAADAERLDVPFTGNRVDLVIGEGGVALKQIAVQVDGQPPTAFPGTYLAETPWFKEPDESRPVKVGVPVRVKLPEPEADEWRLEVTAVHDEGAEVLFKLYSERHGFQGAGTSAAKFVAPCGCVALHPEDWFVRETPEFFHMLPAVAVGETVKWAVRHMSRATVTTGNAAHCIRECQALTAVQGVPNEQHVLTLSRRAGGHLPLEALRVYRPPL